MRHKFGDEMHHHIIHNCQWSQRRCRTVMAKISKLPNTTMRTLAANFNEIFFAEHAA